MNSSNHLWSMEYIISRPNSEPLNVKRIEFHILPAEDSSFINVNSTNMRVKMQVHSERK